MEPLLVNEKLVSFFKFWATDKLQNGMRYSNELFRQVRTFAFSQRQKVYALGWALAERGLQVVITWSHQGYAIWVCLRSADKLQKAVEETQTGSNNHLASIAASFSNAKTEQNFSRGSGLPEHGLVPVK